MATNSLVFDFLARDKASKTFDKLASKSDGLGSKMANFGKATAVATGVVAAGGILALGKAMVDGGKSLARIEKIGAQTNAVLKSTGGVSKVSRTQVDKLAGSLESLTSVEAETITEGQNLLLTFTRIRNETGKGNDIFNQSTKIMTDMSVALGQDMKSSAIQLGKALNDPIKGITALQRVGVSFTKSQREQIEKMVEAGDTMGAQKVILRELTAEFGGSAEALGKTTAGKIERFKHALGTLQEQIASAVLPALTSLSTWALTEGIPKLERFGKWVSGTLVPKVSGAFKAIGDAVSDIFGDLDVVKIGKDLLKGAAGWASDIIDGLGEGLDKGDWSGLGRSVGDGLVRAIGSIGQGIGNIVTAIGDLFAKVNWIDVGTKVGKLAFPFALGLITGIGDGIIDAIVNHPIETVVALLFSTVIGKAFKALGKFIEKIPFVRIFAPFFNFLGSIFERIGKFVDPITKGAGKLIGGFFTGIGRGLGIKGPAFIGRFKTWLGELPTRIGVAALNLAAAAGRMMDRLGQRLIQGGEAVGRIMRRGFDWVTRPFRTAGSWLLNVGGNLVGGLKNGIVNSIRGIGGWIKRNMIDPIVNAVKRFFGIRSPSTVFAGIGGNLVGGLMKGMARTSGAAIARKIFGDMPSALGAIVNKGLVSISSLPRKALGALGNLGGKLAGLFGGGGGNAANMAIGQQLAAGRGWTGAQWQALRQLWINESGWNNNAQNPSSTAFGIAQFLDSTWAGTGYSKSANPMTQILAGMQYISSRYGNPANALAFWNSQSPHWYGDGGLINEMVLGVGMRTGRKYGFGEKGPEMVTPLGRGGGGTQRVVLELDFTGGDEDLIRMFRKAIRTKGGNVQAALGR